MAKVNISESIVATTRKQNGRFLEKQQHDAKTTATGETALRFDIVGFVDTVCNVSVGRICAHVHR